MRKRPILGVESNGTLMTPEAFDNADFDECWRYELIDGVLFVSELSAEPEADANDELGSWLRNYQEHHSDGRALDKTLPALIVRCGKNRRLPDRVLWVGLGRLPRMNETPAVIVDFVPGNKRDRKRDYNNKRQEFQQVNVQEYWIIDRFRKIMTAHILDDGKYRPKIVQARQIYRTKLLPGFELPLERLFKLADQWNDQEQEDTP